MKKIGKLLLEVVKKVVFAFCLIYAFNLIASGLDLFIPINIVTISGVALLGIPGLIALIVIYFVIH